MKRKARRVAVSALFVVLVAVGAAPMASAQAPSGGGWMVVKMINTVPTLNAVSCVKQGGTAVSFPDADVVQIVHGDPIRIGLPLGTYDPAGIACPTFEQWVIAGFGLGRNGTIQQVTDGLEDQPPVLVPPPLRGVACAGPTWCVAVGAT